MDTATKAALFNALLFPGWGQFYLKRYKRGLIFLLPVLFGIIVLAAMVVHAGATVIKAAPFKKGTVQLIQIMDVTLKALKTIDLRYFLLMLILIALLWLLSIIDAYQLGKKMMSSPKAGSDQGSLSEPL
ncbi:MAG: hypothetical protein EG826_12545 [Deltaproteobacteria bacterium]|nr:hypothetical protein [Deltaproteobacteria bacterium]